MLAYQSHHQVMCGCVGAGQQLRKQIHFLVIVMILARAVEVAQYSLCRLLCLSVTAVSGQVLQQFCQRAALRQDPAVAGAQHFQRRFKSGGGSAAG